MEVLQEKENVEKYVSTRRVSEALGVSVSTVKRWVDRGIVQAHRTAGGHRKLLLADVLRLARDGDFPRLDLSKLEVAQLADDGLDVATLRDRLISALRHEKGPLVRSLIVGAFQNGLPIERLADEVIAPVMMEVGHQWATGTIDVMHEHRATHQLTAALFELRTLLNAEASDSQPVAVGGAPEDDFYSLPSLLAELSLLSVDWKVANLGPNTPMSSFHQALEEFRPRLVFLSVSYLEDPDQFVREYRDFYHAAERNGVAIAVGGREMAGHIRCGIPYTTYGDGLSHLVAFARSLHPLASRPPRGRPRED